MHNNTIQNIVDATVADIKSALKEFGEHSYFDVGADEVMDIKSATSRFAGLSPTEMKEVYTEVTNQLDEYISGTFFTSVIRQLENTLDEDSLNGLDWLYDAVDY